MSYQAVFGELSALADPERVEKSKRFFKSGPGEYGEGDLFLGISVPNQRKIAKKYKNIALAEVKKLISNKYHEARLTAVFILVYRIHRAEQAVIDEVAEFYLAHLEFVNNWDIVDSSCYFILAKYLENKDRTLLYTLAKSKNLWERRISIISCYHFIKQNDFEDALAISRILINDDQDIIHKAVGWMLREIGEKDQETEEHFLLQEQCYKTMPRTMLRYAIEKFDEPLRKSYLKGTI